MRLGDDEQERSVVASGAGAEDAKPIRPLLPDFWCATVALLATCLVLTQVGWLAQIDVIPKGLPIVLMVVIAALGFALSIAGRHASMRARVLLYRASIGIFVAVLCCFVSSARSIAASFRVANVTVSSCRLDPVEDPKIGASSISTICNVRRVDGAVLGKVLVQTDEVFDPGRLYQVAGSLEPLDDSSWHRYLYMKGCVAIVNAHAVISSSPKPANPVRMVRTWLLDAISPSSSPSRALIAGVICGRTTELSQTQAQTAFSLTGLTHLVAVSGSHLAYIAMLIESLLLALGCPVRTRSVVVACIMGVYVVFTGCAASAMRSFLMVGCSSLTLAVRRRPHALSGLALSCMLLCAFNPKSAWDLGFQLSAASVLFLNLFCSYVAWTIERAGAPRLVSQQLSMTLTAQWATLPLTVPVFGSISIVSLAANLVVGPLMTALLAAGLVLVPISVLAPLRAVAMIPLDGLANASIFFADALSKIPFATITADGAAPYLPLLYLVALAVYALWPVIPRLGTVVAVMFAGVAFTCHVIYWSYFVPPSITVMDVGQGDSIIIREGSSSLLVDAGVDEAALEALVRNNVVELDGVVITHWDKDHWGGLPAILQRIPVRRLFLAKGAVDAMPKEIDASSFEEIVELGSGDSIAIGSFTCDVVWPQEDVSGDENGDSTCLVATYDHGGRSLRCLLTGDTELDQERAYQRDVGNIDVLKLGHHGSGLSVDGDLLKAIDPEVSIASAGRGNSYGHPSQECVDCVRSYGSQFYCTIDCGDICIEPWQGAVKIRCSRNL